MDERHMNFTERDSFDFHKRNFSPQSHRVTEKKTNHCKNPAVVGFDPLGDVVILSVAVLQASEEPALSEVEGIPQLHY